MCWTRWGRSCERDGQLEWQEREGGKKKIRSDEKRNYLFLSLYILLFTTFTIPALLLNVDSHKNWWCVDCNPPKKIVIKIMSPKRINRLLKDRRYYVKKDGLSLSLSKFIITGKTYSCLSQLTQEEVYLVSGAAPSHVLFFCDARKETLYNTT